MKFIIFSICLLLTACSHDFKGSRPDFTKTGNSAEKEIEKYQIHYISKSGVRIGDDPLLTSTRFKTVEPLIEEVSPKALEQLNGLDTQYKIHYGLLGSMIGLLIIDLADNNDEVSTPFWYVWGATLLHGFYLSSKLDDVADRYNKDLKKKFTPVLGWRTTY